MGVASGNRSDVRAAALSYDDSLLLTTGNGGTKVWNPASGVCVNSLETGYGLCCLFAPGGRYAVLGCKDGKLDVIDLGAAAVAHRVDAHTAQVCSYLEVHVRCGIDDVEEKHAEPFISWFADLGRYAPLGCKDGKLDVIDLGAAAVAHRVDVHTAQVVIFVSSPSLLKSKSSST